jgi:hypothetical protein
VYCVVVLGPIVQFIAVLLIESIIPQLVEITIVVFVLLVLLNGINNNLGVGV